MKQKLLRRLCTACAAAIITLAACPALTVPLVSASPFTESTETILNPGMGYTSTLWYRCVPNNTPVQNPTGALVLMFIDIGAFSSGENGTTDDAGNYTPGKDYPLDDAFFAGLRGTLENCRKNGCTIAMRFRYDDDGTRDPEPATFDMLKTHIGQIGDSGILQEYSDLLMFVESGFVGCYGEQWGGKYCSLAEKAELLDLLLDIVPDPIPVTVRTPNIFSEWAGISRAELATWVSEPNSRAARVGLYDDGYMGSDSDLGTYADREAETGWVGRQTLTSYFGGEFSGNLEFAQQYDTYLPENAIREMYRTHLSYINSNIFELYKNYTFSEEYDVEGVDNSAYYGQSVYKFIRDHLGYRFVMRGAGAAQSGNEIHVSFQIENTGFANPIREQKAELILEKDGKYIRTPVDVDSRYWYSCTKQYVNLEATLPGWIEAGTWNVFFKLSVGDNEVSQTELRSVRFANDPNYSAALGANYIADVYIKPPTNPVLETRLNFGDGDDTLYTLNDRQITDGAVSYLGEQGEPAAETDNAKIWLRNDEQYLYITAQYDESATAEVHNFQLDNADTGEHYWLYYASNGFIYFNQGTPTGCLQKHANGIVELRVPFGEVMGLSPGVTLKNIRYFLQDSANDWKVLSDVKAAEYKLDGSFPVYTAEKTVTLKYGADLTLSVADGAAQPAAYQWYHDGEAIDGATAAVYTLPAADRYTPGKYTVQITSATGAVREVAVCNVEGLIAWSSPRGDVNADGSYDLTDAVALQKYLLTVTTTLPSWEAGDMNADGKLTAADLTLLKRMLLQ